MTDRPGAAPSSAILCVTALVAALVTGVAPARAQDSQTVLYRVFLADGSTLVSFGEFARVADRVVFSMPLDSLGASGAPRLQLVTIPASAVDWATTDRYTDSARASHYASTRGEAEFATLSGQVAWALNAIPLTNDPRKRLHLAEQARQAVGEWSRTSFGYRARDIADLKALLDEVVSELRVSAGVDRFELNLVANVEPPPPIPLMPAPTLKESIEQVLTAARLSPEPAGRVDLLRSAMVLLDGAQTALPASWVTGMRTRAIAELSAELRLEKSYGDLTATTLAAGNVYAKRADVRGVERLVKKALETDEALGRRRPDVLSALLTALDEKLNAARRLRLARDNWQLRAAAYKAYRRDLAKPLVRVDRAKAALDDIRRLAGPHPSALERADRQLGEASSALARVKPPDDLRSIHTMLTSALQLARSACRVRRQAVESGRLAVAWDASSAAAGALILLDRATSDLARVLKPPQLQ